MVGLAGIFVFGMIAQWLAWRVKIPSILPLIIIGLLVGPFSTYFIDGGQKLIDAENIFQDHLLFDFISISVGVILFEGGINLKIKEVRTVVGTVRNLLFVGAFITMLGTFLAAHYILGIEWRIALLLGSMMIVTGPTVVGPLLRSIKPNSNISTVLKWEGVLIDPIGALVAILVFEFITAGTGTGVSILVALKAVGISILAGSAFGAGFAFLIYFVISRKLIPSYLRNIVVLGMVVMAFVIAEMVHHESGLIATTLMGIILSNTKLQEIKHIIHFKEDISRMLISVLFIMLSSSIDLTDFQLIGWSSVWLVLLIVYVLRPLSVFASSINSGMSIREKLFVSWICPRGIVAVGVASILSIRIMNISDPAVVSEAEKMDAQQLLPLTFIVILFTVIVQSLSGKWMAKKLGVLRRTPKGILIIGANEASIMIAKYIQELGYDIMINDISKTGIEAAKKHGIKVHESSLLIDDAVDDTDLSKYGQMWSMTSNNEINMLARRMLKSEFTRNNMYRYISKKELTEAIRKPENLLFEGKKSYIGLANELNEHIKIQEEMFESREEMEAFVASDSVVPIFLIKKNAFIMPLTAEKRTYLKGEVLVYFKNNK